MDPFAFVSTSCYREEVDVADGRSVSESVLQQIAAVGLDDVEEEGVLAVQSDRSVVGGESRTGRIQT